MNNQLFEEYLGFLHKFAMINTFITMVNFLAQQNRVSVAKWGSGKLDTATD